MKPSFLTLRKCFVPIKYCFFWIVVYISIFLLFSIKRLINICLFIYSKPILLLNKRNKNKRFEFTKEYYGDLKIL
jgi:hypothetical protein